MIKWASWLIASGLTACGHTPVDSADDTPIVCADNDPLKQVRWGDLHVHTSWSFDAGAYDSVLTTEDAYRFAKGETVGLPPLDENGQPTRSLTIDRPLDFVGVTEHGEFLGEILICTTPGLDGYDSDTCRKYRADNENGAFDFGVLMANRDPQRFPDVCGDGKRCTDAARLRWAQVRRAAIEHQDSTPACNFTTFMAYEYTNTSDVSNLHRNVVFRSDVVPALPITHFEAPTPLQLWQGLEEACTDAGTGCDVLVLPHNSNLANGQLFVPDYPGANTPEEQAEIARLRARIEPVVEMFQHKGDSECRNGFEGIPDDPHCGFEKLRPASDEICTDGVGSGGMRLWGCTHPLDFIRNVLKAGLSEEQRIGVNPYALGFIGSTDTHNGTPGYVQSAGFVGHVGVVDDTPEKRLGVGNVTHNTLESNPGGLAAVWSEENSRASIFDAIRRRETFATSGPRIELRFFAGTGLPAELCEQDDRIAVAAESGVPMGGVTTGTPRFFVEATRDSIDLQQIQMIKGWIDADGSTHEQVLTIAGDPDNGAGVDMNTCTPTGTGAGNLCTVWTDPDADPTRASFYYARVLENPTCRWSAHECIGFEPETAPAGCEDPDIETVIQNRAWSSPIWVQP